jgi:hypothetical protein
MASTELRASRIGRSANKASSTTAKFMSAVTTKTEFQLPVASLSTFASGTRKAESPFAVYNRAAFTVANLTPKVSVQVEGRG